MLDEFLKDVARALLQSDINVAMIKQLRENIKNKVNISEMPAGLNKRKVIEKAVFDELCLMLDSKQKPPEVKKGKRNVVMFVGLQARSGLRGYFQGRCIRPAEAKRHQSLDTVLWQL